MMNLKLFVVMGVSWLLEIFASLFNEQSIWWSISDFFNLMQGVLVFFIFVFKRKVLVAFQQKLGKWMVRVLVWWQTQTSASCAICQKLICRQTHKSTTNTSRRNLCEQNVRQKRRKKNT
jgi:hypothetical protein